MKSYLNVLTVPKVSLSETDRLLVIDSEDKVKSLSKEQISSIPTCIFNIDCTPVESEIYTAIKENKPINCYLKVDTSKTIGTCEYLLPIGLDNSKDVVVIRFEHIHYREIQGNSLPQSLERIEVKLNQDGTYSYVDNSCFLNLPTCYLSSTSASLSGITTEEFMKRLTTGNPILVSYKEGDKVIYFNSFEVLGDSSFIAYGYFADKTYKATVRLTLKTCSIEIS